MSFSWQTIPAALRAPLLQSGVGVEHVYKIAHAVFTEIPTTPPEQQRDIFALGSDMLLATWESAPLETRIAETLCSLHQQHPYLTPELTAILKYCARQPQADARLLYESHPSFTGSVVGFENWLTTQLAAGGPTFFLMSRAMQHAVQQNRTDWLRGVIQQDKSIPRPLLTSLLADIHFAEQSWGNAERTYAAAHSLLPLQVWQSRRAECLCRLGQRQEAIELLKTAYTARPWQINTLLRLSDLLLQRDQPGEFPQGQGVVLLYTWNKAQDMDETLHSVAASELAAKGGESRILVLDNGSTDGTPAILRAWEERLAGRMSTITLPVNIGAPAARNWLLALPETRNAAWAAFLDDDVAVPKDWLRGLWAALQAYPTAGVASGHACDYHAPMRQQWTDMHIIPTVPLEGEDSDARGEKFTFSAPHEQSFDFGEFTFMRPCVTAIGCCHIFTRAAMDEGGTFDIRFSPSQGDDVDHDMRRVLAGQLPIYNGHLPILHKRITGYQREGNPRSRASSVGNWYKLQASYSAEEIQRIYAEDQRVMWDDLQMRLALPQLS